MQRLHAASALLWSWLPGLGRALGRAGLALLASVPFVAGWLVGVSLWLAAWLMAAAIAGFERGRQ